MAIDGCDIISSAGTYTLTGNITNESTCFNITSDNVVLDLANFSIDLSNYPMGIYVEKKSNITIKNGKILNAWYGIHLLDSIGVNISGMNIYNTNYRAIWSDNSSNVTISNSFFNGIVINMTKYSTIEYNIFEGTSGPSYAIDFLNSSWNNINNNNFSAVGSDAVHLDDNSDYNSVSFNNITNVGFGVGIVDSSYNEVFNNTVDGGFSCADGIILVGGIIKHNLVYNNQVSGCYDCLVITGNYNNFTHNSMEKCGYNGANGAGIFILSSSNNSFVNNSVTDSKTDYGLIYLSNSHYNVISGGTYSISSSNGVYLSSSNNNQFKDINLNLSDKYGIYATSSIGSLFNNTKIISNQSTQQWLYMASNSNGLFTNTTFLTDSGEINLIGMFNATAKNVSRINLDVTYNKAFLNSTNLTFMNIPSKIRLFNIQNNFSSPAIMKDGVTCSVPDCNNLTSLNAGNVTFNVTGWSNYSIAEADTTYPIFSNYSDDSNSITDAGIGFFNVIVTNTNGTVWLEINNTNITATNTTAEAYHANYTFLINGSYNYTWHAYGSGFSNNLNNSEAREYLVSASTSEVVTETATSGGGAGGCFTTWDCSEWSNCNNGTQERICEKLDKDCYIDKKTKPIEIQNCTFSEESLLSGEVESLSQEKINDIIIVSFSIIAGLILIGAIILMVRKLSFRNKQDVHHTKKHKKIYKHFRKKKRR